MAKILTYSCNICKCPAASEELYAEDFDNNGFRYQLYKCGNCKLVSIHPIPDSHEISNFYNKNYYGGERAKFIYPLEILIKLSNIRKARIIDSYIRKYQNCSNPVDAQIVDIGCGRAHILTELVKLGYAGCGVERMDFNGTVDNSVKLFKTDDFNKLNFAEWQTNAVIFWHVLEHLSDPSVAIETAGRILKSNGLLVISVPNYGSFQSKLFKSYWFHLDLPRHLYHFSNNSMGYLLAKYGFTVVNSSTFSFEQSIYGFIQSSMNKLLFFLPQNSFYSLLRNTNKTFKSYVKVMFFSFLAMILLPFAVIEFIISGITGKGSVISIYSIKK